VSRQPVILIGFDQEINPEVPHWIHQSHSPGLATSPVLMANNFPHSLQEVINCVNVTSSRWGGAHELRLLTEEEVNEMPETSSYVKIKGHYLACQPVEPFNNNDRVTVKIGPKVAHLSPRR
jgi:hypothetical protein